MSSGNIRCVGVDLRGFKFTDNAKIKIGNVRTSVNIGANPNNINVEIASVDLRDVELKSSMDIEISNVETELNIW